MLLPALAKAKAQGQSAVCKSLLHQMGIALQAYADNNNHQYPLYFIQLSAPSTDPNDPSGLGLSRSWFDCLYPPKASQVFFNNGGYRFNLQWTNRLFHCPTYLSEGGVLYSSASMAAWGQLGSYSYNWWGTGTYDFTGAESYGIGAGGVWQVVGDAASISLPTVSVRDSQVTTPSEMFVMGDSRPGNYMADPGFLINLTDRFPGASTNAWAGLDWMNIWALTAPLSGGPASMSCTAELLPAPHSLGYNVAFADGHVAQIPRKTYLYPPAAASHWNRDNQPHKETWQNSALAPLQ